MSAVLNDSLSCALKLLATISSYCCSVFLPQMEQLQAELKHARDLQKLAEASLAKKTSALYDELEGSKRENSELKAKIADLEEEMNANDQPMGELQERILELEELLEVRNNLLQGRDEKLAKREQEVKEAKEHAAQLQDQINDMAESSALLAAQMVDLENFIDQLGARLEEKDRTAKELQDQVLFLPIHFASQPCANGSRDAKRALSLLLHSHPHLTNN